MHTKKSAPSRNTTASTYATRLVDMLRRLNQGEALQPEKLAAEYEVTLRTVQRDLNEKLDFLDLEVQNGSYRVAASKLGLLSLQDITRFAEIAGLEGLYPQLDDTLIRRWLQTSYQNALLVRGPSYEDLSGHENTFNLLQQAIDRCCTVGFRYLKTDGPKVTQRLKPYQLINHDGIWYLAAVDQDKLKCYTLTKIEAPFFNQDDPFTRDPAIDQTLAEEDSIWLNLQKTEVVIKVAAEVATYFKQRKLIAGQKTIKELEDGGLILAGQIAHPNQIWPTVRAWIPHVRIISPESLQADMELQLKAYLNLAYTPAPAPANIHITPFDKEPHHEQPTFAPGNPGCLRHRICGRCCVHRHAGHLHRLPAAQGSPPEPVCRARLSLMPSAPR